MWNMKIKESDWKQFKKLRELALDRMYRRIMARCVEICTDESRDARDRYMELFGHVKREDKKLARAFEQFSRSKAIMAMMSIRSLDLIEDDELEGLSEEFIEFSRPLDD